jgi:hypothetical protein
MFLCFNLLTAQPSSRAARLRGVAIQNRTPALPKRLHLSTLLPSSRKFEGSVLDCFACASRARNDGKTLTCHGVDRPIKSGDDEVLETPMAKITKSFLLLFFKKEALSSFPPRPCVESADGIQPWDGHAACARRYQ